MQIVKRVSPFVFAVKISCKTPPDAHISIFPIQNCHLSLAIFAHSRKHVSYCRNDNVHYPSYCWTTFRVKCIMRQIEEGILPQRVKFREGDELQDLAAAIDQAMCKIGEINERNLKVVEEASACVERVIGQLESDETGIRKPKEELQVLRKCLAEFEIFQKR